MGLKFLFDIGTVNYYCCPPRLADLRLLFASEFNEATTSTVQPGMFTTIKPHTFASSSRGEHFYLQ